MAGNRPNAPTCLSACHPGIDTGTLNRNMTSNPGPVGAGLDMLSSAVGYLAGQANDATLAVVHGAIAVADGVVWVKDAATLYAALCEQGLGFLAEALPPAVDVYSSKPGSNTGLLPFAQALDRRINNMAEAHASFSRKHRTGAMPFDRLARWFAHDDPMKRKLLDFYIEGPTSLVQGKGQKNYKLTLDEMKLMPTYIDFFNTGAQDSGGSSQDQKPYSPNLRGLVEEAKKGRPVSVNLRVSGQNDPLGNFAVQVRGVIKPATGLPSGPINNPYSNKLKPAVHRVPLMFEGEMDWKDYWDFDSKLSKRMEGKSTGRPGTAALAIAAVAALVDGVPFDVTSVTVPVTQYSGRFPDY